MNIPKNTRFTLKRIIEGIQEGSIPDNGWGKETKTLTPEQKQKLQSMVSMFETYGEALQNEDAIMNSAKGLSELCELAEAYAITDCADSFQKNIVVKDFKRVTGDIAEYSKIAKEAYALIQQLRSTHQNIGSILGKYYDLKNTTQNDSMPVDSENPLEENDDKD